ncbi:fungal-specific transcription factor domain-containing protein [Hypoxylon sp. FL1284]|nr:fungal-specific transcription factor domain-containing protein [Hypoxylon sp. FL1284]
MSCLRLGSKRRSRRRSKGPGLQLSWPKSNDSKRARVAKLHTHPTPYNAGRVPTITDSRMVHVSQADVETHYHLASPSLDGPPLSVTWSCGPIGLAVEDRDMWQYFLSTASLSLPIFPHDPAHLGRVLAQVALIGDTNSAKAAQLALLAFAWMHLHNNTYSQAVELKIAALEALKDGSKDEISTVEAFQHVAAGMLLCSFEIYHSSCTSGDWICYLGGVKEIIKTNYLDNPSRRHGELEILLDWVHYFGILGRFSRIYWQDETAEEKSPIRLCEEAFPSDYSATESTQITELFGEVCNAVDARPPPTASAETLDDYRNFLKILDWRIKKIQVEAVPGDRREVALTTEVYKLGMLVYLNRATEDELHQAPRIQQQIDEAFALLSRMASCPRQFPVFIIGCEARTDVQRATVLDLIARTERSAASRSFSYTRVLMEAIWAQDDLSNGEISYRAKISRVFRRGANLPMFV